MTFSSFLFVAAHGFVFTAKWGKARPKVPIRYVGIMSLRKINLNDEHASLLPNRKWMCLVLAHFFVSVVNNMTPGLNISMPLHMIFRSVGG